MLAKRCAVTMMPSELSGRIGAHQAKQVIIRIMREAERAKVVASFRQRIGEMIMGQVKRVGREAIILDLGDSAEGSRQGRSPLLSQSDACLSAPGRRPTNRSLRDEGARDVQQRPLLCLRWHGQNG